MKIHLASKSPRRRELLEQLGIEFDVIDIDIDETWDGNEPVKNYVQRLALEKARAAKDHLGDSDHLPILAADTEVVLDDIIMGKPKDKEDAIKMLHSLSGRTHFVFSAVALIYKDENIKLNTNRVCFRPLTTDEIKTYCETGEPFGKAGAYAIQGRAAAFIERLEGSYSGVMGLPLYETSELLRSIDLLK
jgi:septum formation protein